MTPRMNQRLAMLVGALLASPALATTLVALDVPGLTKLSDVVVRARVNKVEAKWNGDRTRIFTHAQLQTVEVLKGNASTEVTAIQPGGEVGELGQIVHGTAKFTPGEELVVFLERRGPFYTVTGMVQGKFVLVSGDKGVIEARPAVGASDHLVESATQQPVGAKLAVMPYEQLKSLVKNSVGTLDPAPATKPGVTLPKTQGGQ